MNRPSILIAEDYVLIQEMIRLLLEPECDVVATAEDAKGVRSGIEKYHPEIVLLDVSLPGDDGFEVMEELARDRPEIKVIFVTAHRNKDYVTRAFAMGAKGYVLKTTMAAELLPAIRAVSAGQLYRSALLS
jgi:DNA-binding NarL/FixJ family response regulator